MEIVKASQKLINKVYRLENFFATAKIIIKRLLIRVSRIAPVDRLWTVPPRDVTASFPLRRGGNVNQSTTYLFNNAGDNGFYWSSTPNSSTSNAYNLRFYGTSNINPSNNWNRYNGFSVRCLYSARSPKSKNIL